MMKMLFSQSISDNMESLMMLVKCNMIMHKKQLMTYHLENLMILIKCNLKKKNVSFIYFPFSVYIPYI